MPLVWDDDKQDFVEKEEAKSEEGKQKDEGKTEEGNANPPAEGAGGAEDDEAAFQRLKAKHPDWFAGQAAEAQGGQPAQQKEPEKPPIGADPAALAGQVSSIIEQKSSATEKLADTILNSLNPQLVGNQQLRNYIRESVRQFAPEQVAQLASSQAAEAQEARRTLKYLVNGYYQTEVVPKRKGQAPLEGPDYDASRGLPAGVSDLDDGEIEAMKIFGLTSDEVRNRRVDRAALEKQA